MKTRFFLCLANEGGCTEVSVDDVEALAGLSLCAHPSGYVAAHLVGRRSSQLLHRVIAGRAWTLPVRRSRSEGQIDHINGDKRDNRRENLRIVTQSQNLQNARALKRNNRSGVKGVYWHRTRKAWIAAVVVPGKGKLWLGQFSTVEDAAAARRAGELAYYTHAPVCNRE